VSKIVISFFAFSGLLNFVASFLFGILIYLKKKKELQSKSFVLYFFSIAFWNLGYYFWQISTEESSALFWSRFLMAGAIFIPIFYFHLIISFLNYFEKYKKALYVGYILTFLFLLLDFTPYFVEGTEKKLIFPFWPEPGIFFHPFLLMFSALICYGWYLLLKTLRKTTEKIRQQQIKYLLLGTGIGAIGGSTNYFLWYDLPILPYGNILVIFGVLLITFAILKYHLFETKVLLTELLVGSIGIVLIVLPFLMPNSSLRLLTGSVAFLFLIFGFLLVKATYEEVRRKEEAERLLKAKTEFLSIASHQLRTPLTAIIGYSSMLKEGDYGKLPGKASGAIGRVYDSSQRMIKLVNDFLSVSRLETGKTVLKPREVSLRELINQTIAELNFKAQEKKLYIKYEQPKIDKIVKIDPEKLKEVISNLIDNSIHYTEKGGITVGANANSSKINIAVSDTGAGMTEEELAKIFESFSRGSAGNELNTQGSGLGLYIAKKFVEMHNGKIWAESEGKNKGSTFYIDLPNK
jgi:signal transduction histidine kinase